MREHDVHVQQSLAVKLCVADLADVRPGVRVHFPHVPVQGDLRGERFLALGADEVATFLVDCPHVALQFALIVEYFLALRANVGSWIGVHFVSVSIQVHLLMEDVVTARTSEFSGLFVHGTYVALQPRRIVEQFTAQMAHVWPCASVNFVSVSVKLRLELKYLERMFIGLYIHVLY